MSRLLKRLVSSNQSDSSSFYETLPSVERPKTPNSYGTLPSFGDVAALQPLGNTLGPGTRREWLHIDANGSPTYLQVDKHRLVSELGINYRDVRILDPMVPTPSPSTIFIRDKAILVNLESLRMIVCHDKVFLLSAPVQSQPLTVGTFPAIENFFVRDLCIRLKPERSPRSGCATPLATDRNLPYELRAVEGALAAAVRSYEAEVAALEARLLPCLHKLLHKLSREELNVLRHCKSTLNKLLGRMRLCRKSLESILDDNEDMALMFLGRRERARVAAEAERKSVGAGSGGAQGAAAADDEELVSRAQEQGDEFGDEDATEDGDEYEAADRVGPLTPSEAAAAASAAAQFSAAGGSAELDAYGAGASQRGLNADPNADLGAVPGGGGCGGGGDGGIGAATAPVAIPGAAAGAAATGAPTLCPAESAPATQFPASEQLKAKSSRWRSGSFRAKLSALMQAISVRERVLDDDASNISSCENLLEAYFMQIDYLTNRLDCTDEHVKSTEEQLTMELDHRRNELVAFDLFMTGVATIFAAVGMVGGIFGMNMPLPKSLQVSETAFLWTTFYTCFVGFLMFVGFVLFARWKRLLFIPSAGLGDR
ncbi:hypothetical protein WJX81_006572 [Elliptochloris bilobata]|uniref:Magnesium transporter n=1 Tax=Elliptochloris bilobata TaxID=381761 RepID=A0AAW1SBY8_9CHLO